MEKDSLFAIDLVQGMLRLLLSNLEGWEFSIIEERRAKDNAGRGCKLISGLDGQPADRMNDYRDGLRIAASYISMVVSMSV